MRLRVQEAQHRIGAQSPWVIYVPISRLKHILCIKIIQCGPARQGCMEEVKN